MSDFTSYIETEIAEWFSQGTDMPTAPDPLFVALHTGDPGNDASANEVSAADYDRVSTAASTDWSVSGNGPATITNDNAIEFGVASNNWGTVSYATLWDSQTGGNPIGIYEVTNPKEIAVDDEARFPSGDMTFDID